MMSLSAIDSGAVFLIGSKDLIKGKVYAYEPDLIPCLEIGTLILCH